MTLILKALVALMVGVVIAFIVGHICTHFGVDMFWGWLAGVIAGLAYFLYGPNPVTRL